jgi:hypothetical protein
MTGRGVGDGGKTQRLTPLRYVAKREKCSEKFDPLSFHFLKGSAR